MRPAVEQAHAVATDRTPFAVALRRALFAPVPEAASIVAKERT